MNYTRPFLKMLQGQTKERKKNERLREGAKGFRTKVRKRALWIAGTRPKQS